MCEFKFQALVKGAYELNIHNKYMCKKILVTSECEFLVLTKALVIGTPGKMVMAVFLCD